MAKQSLKTYVLTLYNMRSEKEEPLGVFHSPDAAQQHAADRLDPDARLPWRAAEDSARNQIFWGARIGNWRYEIRDHDLTREGSPSRNFDVAVLRMAAEILKDRFGVIITENERKALISAAERIETRAASMSSEVLKDERGDGQ